MSEIYNVSGVNTKKVEKFVFVGSPGVGKTFLAKYCSKVLASHGKKVALVDAARNRGLYYSTCTGEEEMETNALMELSKGKNRAIAYGNIDIFTNKPSVKDVPYLDVFTNLQAIQNEYDAILIDADFESALEISSFYSKMFLVQDFKRQSAVLNQQQFLLPLVLKMGEGCIPSAVILYNKAIPCKLKIEQIEPYLMFAEHKGKHLKLLLDIKPDEVEIPFDQENYLADINNAADGIIELKRLTQDIKKSLYSVCNIIVGIENKLKRTF